MCPSCPSVVDMVRISPRLINKGKRKLIAQMDTKKAHGRMRLDNVFNI
jgi:hypothetical protein